METALLILIGLFMLLLVLCRDVDPKQNRRLLQNMVYRLYKFVRWCLAVVEGVDHAVCQFYQALEDCKIEPVSEKKFKPQPRAPQQQASAALNPAEEVL